MNTHAEEINESEKFRTFTNRLCEIIDAKYEKEALNKVMKNHCQHLTEKQRNELLKLLQNQKGCSMEHLVSGK